MRFSLFAAASILGWNWLYLALKSLDSAVSLIGIWRSKQKSICNQDWAVMNCCGIYCSISSTLMLILMCAVIGWHFVPHSQGVMERWLYKTDHDRQLGDGITNGSTVLHGNAWSSNTVWHGNTTVLHGPTTVMHSRHSCTRQCTVHFNVWKW